MKCSRGFRLLNISLFFLIPQLLLAAEPDDTLVAAGLRRVDRVWLSQTEFELRERLANIDRLDRRFQEARKTVENLLDQNEQLRVQLTQLTADHKRNQESANAVKSGSPQRKLFDEELKRQSNQLQQLKRSIVEPDKLGGSRPLKPAAIELANSRAEVTLSLLAIHRLAVEVPNSYEQLRKHPRLAAAIDALEPPRQLGAGKNYATESSRLSRIEKLVLGDTVGLYREGKQLRLGAIANEETPLTFSLFESTEPTIITHGMAELLGLKLDARGEKTTIRVDGKRDVALSKAKIATLRLGRHVIADLETLVLPPEEEHLGARICTHALGGLRPRVDAARLTLKLEGASQGK